jgi:hypothetical protein
VAFVGGLLVVAVMVWGAFAAGGLVLVAGDIGGVKIMGETEEEGGVVGGVRIIAVADAVAVAVAIFCGAEVGRSVDDDG